MAKKIALFYGTDTGATEIAAEQIVEHLGEELIDIYEVHNSNTEDFEGYEYLILGVSTWYIGELQSEWDLFYDDFKTIDFTGKKVAIFGMGDQFGYPDTFVDGIGFLGKVVLENGGVLVGKWPTEGYQFDESVGELENGFFCGLALDDDNEFDLSEERIKNWVAQIIKEFRLGELAIG